MRALDIMQKGVMTVSPELSVADLEEFLTIEEISGVPVMGPAGQILGIVSKTDIVRALSETAHQRSELLQPDLTAGDIMTKETVTVSPDEDVREVAQRMIDGHLHRVIVTSSEDVLGIITTFDLLKLMTREL
jgi:CBS domain-containing protein